MNLPRQIEALRLRRRVLTTELNSDLEIARILRAREILPTLTSGQRHSIRHNEYVGALVRRGLCQARGEVGAWSDGALTDLGRTLRDLLNGRPPQIPVLQRIAQHAIDAHCTARAAARIPGEVSVYDRADLEKYLHHGARPLDGLRVLIDRLLPSDALTLLLSLLPENAS